MLQGGYKEYNKGTRNLRKKKYRFSAMIKGWPCYITKKLDKTHIISFLFSILAAFMQFYKKDCFSLSFFLD